MPIAKPVIERLEARYPHSAELLHAFVPLLDAQEELAKGLTPPLLPPLALEAFASGTAWLPASGVAEDVLLDAPFLLNAPMTLAEAAARGFESISETALALGAFLADNQDACRELALLRIRGRTEKVRPWAEKYAQDEAAATLLAVHLGGAAARRAGLAAEAEGMPQWTYGTCPVCGSRPHGASLKGKEGKRWLQCSLCRHEWIFSRTTCPVCLQHAPEKTKLFFFEDNRNLRAEVCADCGHYLLCADVRDMADAVPVELLLLCMMPLDLLMQQKKHIPVPNAKIPR